MGPVLDCVKISWGGAELDFTGRRMPWILRPGDETADRGELPDRWTVRCCDLKLERSEKLEGVYSSSELLSSSIGDVDS